MLELKSEIDSHFLSGVGYMFLKEFIFPFFFPKSYFCKSPLFPKIKIGVAMRKISLIVLNECGCFPQMTFIHQGYVTVRLIDL